MAKPRAYGYVHVKHTSKKRPGRHTKSYSKRIPKKKKYRGQGR
jgi:hypothetical protein